MLRYDYVERIKVGTVIHYLIWRSGVVIKHYKVQANEQKIQVMINSLDKLLGR